VYTGWILRLDHDEAGSALAQLRVELARLKTSIAARPSNVAWMRGAPAQRLPKQPPLG
jgi:hypothetical protein